jgi:hypothetical protein
MRSTLSSMSSMLGEICLLGAAGSPAPFYQRAQEVGGAHPGKGEAVEGQEAQG